MASYDGQRRRSYFFTGTILQRILGVSRSLRASNTKNLSNILVRGSNNFDLIRLFAALLVMLGHSYGLQNPSGNRDFIRAFLKTDYPGSLAVYTFFLISGILITQSFVRTRNPLLFIIHRIARLWPGLVVNTLIVVFILGPILTFYPTIKQFLLDDSTIRYLVTNTLHVGTVEMNIAGLFDHAGMKHAVNFSLWSLSVESQCYILVFIFGIAGLISKKIYFIPAIVIFTILYLKIAKSEKNWTFTVLFFHRFVTDYSCYPVLFFALGMACYMFRDKILLDWKIALGLILVAMACRKIGLAAPTFTAAFGYIVLMIASSDRLRRFNPKFDYSYGIYIYGFLCQQIVADRWGALSSYAALAVSVAMAFAFAVFSWHCVESPAIRFCKTWSDGMRKAAPAKMAVQ